MRLSILIPTLNEAEGIQGTLATLQGARRLGHEVLVVDGGSTDETVARATPLADGVIRATRGRAAQMNAGARAARGAALLFLHADTRLPATAVMAIQAALARAAWGRFDVSIDGESPLLRVVAAMMNWRSRRTGIATGDQALFVTRAAFERVGGYPEIPLMEDIELSKALKRIGRPACLREQVVTSGRRWETHGVWRTILLMWSLRLAHWRGVPASELARRYASGKHTARGRDPTTEQAVIMTAWNQPGRNRKR
ncbi:TIGR04283 family arsenosugar biosynthesis glycosyltransferase [Thioalkalicoccus limnaeus]|uniref:TIGR04283 family arsenosugar biosynthesis glycosyltransferase n=1 Tax=Thioalkalicoccus limnaeus TaxID=120681 RepID=A0ABV4BFU4_9GAMM